MPPKKESNMKNKDMKVTELLKLKESIEHSLDRLDKAYNTARSENSPNVSIKVCENNYCTVSTEALVLLIDSEVARLAERLCPINKKLEAIELMLNS
jgi:hypothetical protein